MLWVFAAAAQKSNALAACVTCTAMSALLRSVLAG